MKTQENISILDSSAIKDAIIAISANSLQIVCVVTSDNTFLGTVTDGDIRRGLIKGLTIESPILEVLHKNSFFILEDDLRKSNIGSIPNGILVIPILTSDNKLVRLIKVPEAEQAAMATIPVVIMAGGKGERLKPLTNTTPKPMLKIGEKPILEKLVEDLFLFGFRDIHITVNYLAEQIVEHFGDGSGFGVSITIHQESAPRGTAGSLSEITGYLETPILVMNADLITSVNLNALIAFHNLSKNEMTICTREYETQIPFGVVKTDSGIVTSITEKPTLSFSVNAGLYVVNAKLLESISKTEHLDMDKFINRVLDSELKTGSFPIFESWLDVGRHNDLIRAKLESF
jgi:dTDP-glucose pyrophosphorylase